MKEFNYVPIFRQGINEITDGIEISATAFCKKNCGNNKRCQEHYEKLLEGADGSFACPYGFASVVFSDDCERYIFTGLRLEKVYVAKQADPKVKEPYKHEKDENGEHRKQCRKISKKELESFVQYYLEYKQKTEAYERLRLFVEDIFHDIRKFNGQLKNKSTSLYRKANGARKSGDFVEISRNIDAICSYMTLRLNAYDFTHNEELLTATEKSSYNIYKIFDKVKHCLKDRATERRVNISISCNGECGETRAYDSLELLPYILLDNAIKYAKQGSRVNVIITDSLDSCGFRVCSNSEQLEKGEHDKVFLRGFRGKNARQMTTEGLGIGLYVAKKICDIHEASIKIEESYDCLKKVNNFIIDVMITKEYTI